MLPSKWAWVGWDMFQAYACDDNSAHIIRSVAVEMGWEQERVYKGGLRNAVQSLSVSSSPYILFVDMSESATRSTTSTASPKYASQARS